MLTQKKNKKKNEQFTVFKLIFRPRVKLRVHLHISLVLAPNFLFLCVSSNNKNSDFPNCPRPSLEQRKGGEKKPQRESAKLLV